MKGLDLAEHFYTQVIEPLVRVRHTACLLGEGSEVLGFDTARSRDHEWGPRVQLLVAHDDIDGVRARVDAGLPDTFKGFDVRWFSLATGTITHHVEVASLDEWLRRQLGFDPGRPMSSARWLATPQQRLLHVTAGRVFRDDDGDLERVRRDLAWYPPDVWRWMMSSSWHLIGNTQPLRARCLETGDLLGAPLLTARLCRMIMDLAFLQQRRYHPYDKWYGAAFAELPIAATLSPLISTAVSTPDQADATAALNAALATLGERHNTLDLTAVVSPQMGRFDVGINDARRPYDVINASDYIESLRDSIDDPALRGSIPVGAIDQLTHADDAVVTHTDWPERLYRAYRGPSAAGI